MTTQHLTRLREKGAISVAITAGSGDLVVSGLEEEEATSFVHAWSRCRPIRCDGERSDQDRAALASMTWDQFHEELVHRATARAIESCRGTHLMFHAACLANPETGAAVVLSAASGTGKTTATRTLGPEYAYLTDEAAIVDPGDLTIVPFPKPLSLLGPDGRRPKRQVGPDELGLGPTREATLRCVAVLDRVWDAGTEVTAHSEPMSLADALTHLVPQTSSLVQLRRGLVALCRTLDRLGGARRLVYAEAADLKPVVDMLLAEEPRPVDPAWDALEEAELAATPPASAASTAETDAEMVVRRRAAVCGIQLEDGRLALLMDHQLVILDGLGPSVWLLLDEPRTMAGLLAELTAEGDVRADASAILEESVRSMRAAGVLASP